MLLRPIAFLCIAAALLFWAGAGFGRATAAAAHWEAVLAAGDRAQPVFDNAVAAFAKWLTGHGVAAADIHRLSADPAALGSAVDAASEQQLLRDIALLPARPGDGCLIFLTSHGERGAGAWLAYSGEVLPPTALAQALSIGCGAAPTVVIISACYSGSFAAGPMLAPNRIVLTAARADRPSFGCQADRTYTVFDECLLGALPRGRLWRQVFEIALACVRERERQLRVLPSEPRAFFGSEVRDLPVPDGPPVNARR